MYNREESLKELERKLARAGFWYAVQMAILAGIGVFLFSLVL